MDLAERIERALDEIGAVCGEHEPTEVFDRLIEQAGFDPAVVQRTIVEHLVFGGVLDAFLGKDRETQWDEHSATLAVVYGLVVGLRLADSRERQGA